MSDPTTPNRPWPKAVPLLALATLLAYANAVNTGFVLDDNLWITTSTSIANPVAYLQEAGDRAVAHFTVLVNYQLGGTNPLGYHLFNVAVHLAAGLTLFALLRRVFRLPKWGGRFDGRADGLAFAAALLWLVHPLNTQAVTYVIQRIESLMGLFFLLTFYCWTRAATGGVKWVWFPLTVLCYLAACFCKEVAVTLFPLLVLFDRVFLANSWRGPAGRWPGFAGVGAVWVMKLYRALGGAFGGGTATGAGFGLQTTPAQYALTETEVILLYLKLAVWPVGQSADYGSWPVARSFADVAPAAVAVGVLLVASAVALFVRPAVGFLAAWFFVILAPTSSVMPLFDVAFEYRMYLPLVAVVVGVVLGADALLRLAPSGSRLPRLAAVTALAVAALFLVGRTNARNAVYRDQTVYWQTAYAERPQNLRAKAGVAIILIEQGRYAEADELLNELDRQFPGLISYRAARGDWFYQTGDIAAASKWFRETLENPQPFTSRFVGLPYAKLLLAQGDTAGAAKMARRLTAEYPNSASFQSFLAVCELAAGRETEARAAVEAAVQLDPSTLAQLASGSRARVFARPSAVTKTSQLELAYRYAAAACRADADHPEWFDTLAMAAAHTNRFPEAVAAAKAGIAAAERANDPVWKAALQDRLKLYEAGKVYGPKE